MVEYEGLFKNGFKYDNNNVKYWPNGVAYLEEETKVNNNNSTSSFSFLRQSKDNEQVVMVMHHSQTYLSEQYCNIPSFAETNKLTLDNNKLSNSGNNAASNSNLDVPVPKRKLTM